MQCMYCKREYSAAYLKRHVRYNCLLNPKRDIMITRKRVLKKIEEKKVEVEDVRHGERAEGWIEALTWLLEDKKPKKSKQNTLLLST